MSEALRLSPSDKPPYSFCEGVHATGTSPWHIRPVNAETGLHPSGGIDTGSLCGRVQPRETGWGGWDLLVRMTESHLEHACPTCVERYRSRCQPLDVTGPKP